MVAVYHDDPEVTPEDELRSDASVTVAESQSIPDEMGALSIPSGKYGRYTHIGPYEHLGDVWARLLGVWLAESVNSFGPGSTLEIYRNTPVEADPDQLQADLYISVD